MNPIERTMKKRLEQQAKKIGWCKKGGSHYAQDRNPKTRCVKCGLTIEEISKQISEMIGGETK